MQHFGTTYLSFIQKLATPGKAKSLKWNALQENFRNPGEKIMKKSRQLMHSIFLNNNEYTSHNLDEMLALHKASSSTDSKACCEPPPPPPPPGKHDYHEDTENIVNDQITHELNAAFAYLSLAAHFGRTDVALPGCQGYFFNMHLEEHEHALVFMNYQLMRGGQVKLKSLEAPCVPVNSVTEAFNAALKMEIFVKNKLSEAFAVAEKHKDLHLQDLITTDFMEEQNKSICELGRLLARTKVTDTPLGEYLFDKMIFNSFVEKSYNKLMHKRNLQETQNDLVYK